MEDIKNTKKCGKDSVDVNDPIFKLLEIHRELVTRYSMNYDWIYKENDFNIVVVDILTNVHMFFFTLIV